MLTVSCCSTVERLETPDIIQICDTNTGKPLTVIGVTEIRQLTKFEKWWSTDVFKYPHYD